MTYFLPEMDLLKLETERWFGGLEIRFKWRRSVCEEIFASHFTHLHTYMHTYTSLFKALKKVTKLDFVPKTGCSRSEPYMKKAPQRPAEN